LNNNEKCVAIARQQSFLENEIESLKSAALRANYLVDDIYGKLRPSPPTNRADEKVIPGTVGDSLREIRTIIEETVEQLEGITKLLEAQLGSLKLEY